MNKRTIYSIVILILLIIIFLCYYVFYVYDDSLEKIKVIYDNGNNVEIKNILPVSDTIGKNYNGNGSDEYIQDYKKFSVSNKTNIKTNFIIYIKPNKVNGNVIKTNYIKLFLTDEFDNGVEGFAANKIPSVKDLKVANNKPDSLILYKGVLKGKENKIFKLRVWLADTYAISDFEELYNFDIIIEDK